MPCARSTPASSEARRLCAARPSSPNRFLLRLWLRRSARIRERVGAPLRQGRQRDGRDAVGDERALLAGSEREAEVGQLPESRRSARLRAGLLEHARRHGAHERGGGRARLVSRQLEPWESAAGDRVEVDDRDDAPPVRRRGGEPLGSERAEGAAVGGEEDERVRRARAQRAVSAHRRVATRELDQRSGAGGVVVGSGADARRVAMGQDDDRLRRVAFRHGDDVSQLHLPSVHDASREAVLLRREAVQLHLAGEPLRRAQGARRAR